jgi:ribosomal protein S21
MIKITLRKNETFDSMLRRFNNAVNSDGILKEVRERSAYLKPSVKKRKDELNRRLEKKIVK